MSPSLPFLADTLRHLAADNLLRRRRVTRWLPDGRCEIDGQTVWNFIGNDYLNLAGDPCVVAAADEALHQSGVGSRASALLGGRTEWHERLEKALAEFEGTDAAILFPTGMAANVGTISALVQPNDVVFCDRFNHASLIDGCRLSGAKLRVYRHDDLAGLERELGKAVSMIASPRPRRGGEGQGEGASAPNDSTIRKPEAQARDDEPMSLASASGSLESGPVIDPPLSPAAGARGQDRNQPRIWIITDGVFSMDGDLAPLPALCDLAEKHRAHLIVDEAHATGVFGATGRGVCEYFGVEDRIAVRTGTLSKAVGCLGGFVVGSQALIDFLWNSARTQIYSTALPPAVCAAATAAIDVIQQEPQRSAELLRRAQLLRAELAALGVHVLAGSTGPIIPIVLQDPQRAVTIADRLEARGYLVGAIRPPTVPRGTSRLRISVCLGTPEEILREFARTAAEQLRS